jgi:hypothetical protein
MSARSVKILSLVGSRRFYAWVADGLAMRRGESARYASLEMNGGDEEESMQRRSGPSTSVTLSSRAWTTRSSAEAVAVSRGCRERPDEETTAMVAFLLVTCEKRAGKRSASGFPGSHLLS